MQNAANSMRGSSFELKINGNMGRLQHEQYIESGIPSKDRYSRHSHKYSAYEVELVLWFHGRVSRDRCSLSISE